MGKDTILACLKTLFVLLALGISLRPFFILKQKRIGLALLLLGSALSFFYLFFNQSQLPWALLTALCLLSSFITKREEHEESEELLTAEQKDSLARKDLIYKILVHDISGPLSVALGRLELLEPFLRPGTNGSEQVEKIKSSLNRSVRLVRSARDYEGLVSGKKSLKRELVQLSDIIQQAWSELHEMAHKKNVSLKCFFDEGLLIFGDPLFLEQQVFSNLILNSLKFSTNGQEIHIKASLDEKENILVQIQDFGIGMPPELVSNVFDAKAKTHRPGTEGEKGTGLGLPIVKEVVKLHDGEVWVESVESKGTTFFIKLPGHRL